MDYDRRDGATVWSRVSRRQLLRGAALAGAGLAGAALIGCGDDDDSDATVAAAPSDTPKRGGTLRVAPPPDPSSLDPAISTTGGDHTISLAVYDNLVLRQHDLSLKPMLAESWEPNADNSVYTFKLRPGVKFHHGKEVTAEDVKYTFERLLDPDVASPFRSSIDYITNIVAVDDRTVRFELEGPNSFFVDTISEYQARIVPSDIDSSRLATEEFGSGAFIIEQHIPGERTVFKRNPEYWDGGVPYLDGLIFFYMPEPETRIEALKTGSIDLITRLATSAVDGIDAHSETKVSEVASASYITLAMQTDTPPFDNKRLRQAIQSVLGRVLVREAALFGRGTIASDHPIPPNDPHYWQDQVIPPYDVERAKKLLSEAGYPDGIELELFTSTVNPNLKPLAVTFKEAAAPAGISVKINQKPEDGFWTDVWLKVPFVTVNWNGRNPDLALSVVYKSDAKWNEANYHNPTLDDLIVKARGQDLEGRKETYAEVQRILLDDVPRAIPVFFPVFMGMRTYVRGVAAHPSNWGVLHNAWLDL